MSKTAQWPAEHRFIKALRLSAIRERSTRDFANALIELELPPTMLELLEDFYLPFAGWLEHARRSSEGVLRVGVCGAQGSGKSTLCALLCRLLQSAFGLQALSLSIDDLYKTRVERENLAREIHPLFITRGVPGTHDVELGLDIFNHLCNRQGNETVSIPSFDKSRDDRRPICQWQSISGPLDILFFEGWCVGALAQSCAALNSPINELERTEDPDCVWRQHVNRELQTDYVKLFSELDLLVLLEVEGMHRVFEWRRLQEHKLARRLTEEGLDPDTLAVMSDAQVDRFIMHYERLTRHILAEMPERADLVVHLDHTHNASRTTVRRDLRHFGTHTS